MKALVKEGSAIALLDVPSPSLQRDDDVLVTVSVAGICRSDLHVASGLLPSRDPVILGHELAGVVAATGPAVRGLARGDRVAVNPVIGCGSCARCGAGRVCARTGTAMLGIDRHGAFAEVVCVPARNVVAVPPSVTVGRAAWAEPVAAALAVVAAAPSKEARGLVFGSGRIATLTARVLRARGFSSLEQLDPTKGSPGEDAWDFAVETLPAEDALGALVRAVRSEGTLILKSRPARPVRLDLRAAVQKDLILRGAGWSPLSEALDLLASGTLELGDLTGPSHALEDHARAFAEAAAGERVKHFFSIGPR